MKNSPPLRGRSFLFGQGQALPIPPSLLENKPLLIGTGVVACLFLLVVVVWIRGGKKKVNPEGGLSEDLGAFPPAPAGGKRRLLVQGQPGRLRLVAVAPVGKKTVEASEVDALLNQVVRGLGDIVRQDKPRIRIWPAQLTIPGFAPSFHRLTRRPEPAGRASPWVLLAGPANAEGQQILLGLAFYADQPNKMEQLTLKPLEWAELLDIDVL